MSWELLGVVQALLGVVGLVACSAVALSASRVRALAPRPAVIGALASAAASVVTPAGLGGSVVAARLHQRTGLTAEEAVAAVGLRALASGVAATAVATAAALALGQAPPTPGSSPALVVVLVAVTLLAVVPLVLRCPQRRSRLERVVRRTCSAAAAVLRRPARALVLLVAAAGVTAAQLVVLDGAVDAVGGSIATSSLLLALLGSSAARAALPSPGGIGPVEAALVAALTALGLTAGVALVAVVLHRGMALGLPVLAGVVSLRALRRQHLL